MDDKIPPYWKQKETRKKEIFPPKEDSPLEVKKNIKKEMKPAEEMRINEHKRKRTFTEKIIILIGILVVIAIFYLAIRI
jgi:hypothetical protein